MTLESFWNIGFTADEVYFSKKKKKDENNVENSVETVFSRKDKV